MSKDIWWGVELEAMPKLVCSLPSVSLCSFIHSFIHSLIRVCHILEMMLKCTQGNKIKISEQENRGKGRER